ncbi:MAG: hypothetical protein QOK47_1635, partial [Actinomycetota bacterium]|nr:hypothetical protein [Actinomycetota bacterium]
DGAVTVDMKALMQQFMGGMGATDSGSGSSGGDSMDPEALCDQLKDAPKDVKEQFAEQCPDLGA